MADTTDTVKKTIDQATSSAKAQIETGAAQAQQAQAQFQDNAKQAQAAGAQAFREGVDRSVAGLTELNAHGKKNLEAVVESATVAQRGAEALGQQAVAYSKKSWEDGVAAAQSIAQARSVQEAVELQTAFAKTAIETYLAEMTKMTETFTSTMKDSLQPLNARVSATVESVQAAR